MDSGKARPRDATQTRSHILAEARREFTRVGFAATTVRAVASAANVSPNLITRYFGGKDGLFMAATEVGLHLDSLFDGPRESLGRRLAESMVDRWITMPGQDPLLTLLRASGERPEAAAALSSFLDNESLEPVRQQLLQYGFSEADADSRARAIDVFALGISSRYRILHGDLGDPENLKAWIAETIQRLVDGA